ncbi:MAG: TauD/TfdA family dioxygenase [Bdellovibrionales bacterium]|nr:TauD/TfdA family dioxygenase [Bdellovibrionales bacterium]
MIYHLNPFGVCFKSEKYSASNINVSEIRELLVDHFLVVIKNFNFNGVKEYIDFLEQLGKPFGGGGMWCSHPLSNAIQIVTNKKICKNNTTGLFSEPKLEWHTNGIFCDHPEQIVSLYCKTPGQSATQFLNTSLAIEYVRKVSPIDIDDIMLEISNDNSKTILKERVYDPLPSQEHRDISKHRYRDKGIENTKYANQKIIKRKSFVQKHPLSSIEGCFFPKFNVLKLFSKKNRELRNKDFFTLCDLIFREEFIYTHQWEEGDLLLCDQILTLHRRSQYEGERELYRSALWYH